MRKNQNINNKTKPQFEEYDSITEEAQSITEENYESNTKKIKEKKNQKIIFLFILLEEKILIIYYNFKKKLIT